MDGTERVRNTILGRPTDRQPVYGWVSANLEREITARWGSVAAFEDRYEFDAAHIFGGPGTFDGARLDALRDGTDELLPEHLLEEQRRTGALFRDPCRAEEYRELEESIRFHKRRGRFCYVQTPGFFEQFNGVFGIQDQLMWLALYPEELDRLYALQAEWTCAFADMCLDRGADMIHLSDDWGSQRSLMFSPELWRTLIRPHVKRVADHVHSRGALVSLHSDGCIADVTDGVAELGIDLVHPWQESAGMSYDIYLSRYADRFAIMGGICIQTALGILPRDRLEAEIRRVFGLLRGRRWVVCTTHFVQSHCSVEDLEFAYDLIWDLARK